MSMHFVKHDRMTHVAGDFGELAFLHDPEFFFLKKKKKIQAIHTGHQK